MDKDDWPYFYSVKALKLIPDQTAFVCKFHHLLNRLKYLSITKSRHVCLFAMWCPTHSSPESRSPPLFVSASLLMIPSLSVAHLSITAKNCTRSIDTLKRASRCLDKSGYHPWVLAEHEHQSKSAPAQRSLVVKNTFLALRKTSMLSANLFH